MEFTSTVDIVASVERVWACLTEPDLQRQWRTQIVAQRDIDPGPPMPGSRFEIDLRERGRLITSPGEYLVVDPPRELRLRLDYQGKFPLPIEVAYTLRRNGYRTNLEYRQLVDYSLFSTMLRWFVWVYSPLTRWQLQRVMRQSWDKLRQVAEGGKGAG
ncbi:MAG: SRPBCC family protein [Pirellulales bacterium]|nr:SRPBCC family protein [Pirellulales bacterium]